MTLKKRVRLTSNYASPQGGGPAGSLVVLPKKVANDLIKKGYAVGPDHEPTDNNAQSEPADTPPDETVIEVPSGKVATILEWIGSDPERAEAAIEAEKERGRPRSSLLEQAASIIAGVSEEE